MTVKRTISQILRLQEQDAGIREREQLKRVWEHEKAEKKLGIKPNYGTLYWLEDIKVQRFYLNSAELQAHIEWKKLHLEGEAKEFFPLQ